MSTRTRRMGVSFTYTVVTNSSTELGQSVHTRSIKERVSIEERPDEANGKRFGDWELDLIVEPNNREAVEALVVHSTSYALIKKLHNGKKAQDVADAVYRMLLPFRDTVLTITTDNGSEFSLHKVLAKKLKTKVYFAHPYCCWEKGAIEYTNKLIRQCIPKRFLAKYEKPPAMHFGLESTESTVCPILWFL